METNYEDMNILTIISECASTLYLGLTNPKNNFYFLPTFRCCALESLMVVCVKFLSQIAQETREKKFNKIEILLLLYVVLVLVLVLVPYEPG